MKKYMVIICEHSDSFSDTPNCIGVFDCEKDAFDFVDKCVNESLNDFKDEVREEFGLVRAYRNDNTIDYGCRWSIVEVDIEGQIKTKNIL